MSNQLFNSKVLKEAKHRLIGDYCSDMDMLESLASNHNYNSSEFINEIFKNLN